MTSARMTSRLVKAAAASTLWALTTARASPHWCWTAHGAAASPTRARVSVTSPHPKSAPPQHHPCRPTSSPFFLLALRSPSFSSSLRPPNLPGFAFTKATPPRTVFSLSWFLTPQGPLVWWLKVNILEEPATCWLCVHVHIASHLLNASFLRAHWVDWQ